MSSIHFCVNFSFDQVQYLGEVEWSLDSGSEIRKQKEQKKRDAAVREEFQANIAPVSTTSYKHCTGLHLLEVSTNTQHHTHMAVSSKCAEAANQMISHCFPLLPPLHPHSNFGYSWNRSYFLLFWCSPHLFSLSAYVSTWSCGRLGFDALCWLLRLLLSITCFYSHLEREGTTIIAL